MPTNLDGLPLELYTVILEHVPAELLQQTILALTRAVPYAPIPLWHLFFRIRIREPRRISQLYNRLHRDENARTLVKELNLDAVDADPDVVINLLALLKNLTTFSLLVGPGFTPEQLESLLAHPSRDLNELSLRFRP